MPAYRYQAPHLVDGRLQYKPDSYDAGRTDSVSVARRRRAAKLLRASPRAEARFVRDMLHIFREVHRGVMSVADDVVKSREPETRQDASKYEPIGPKITKPLLAYARRAVVPAFDRMQKTVSDANTEGLELLGIKPSMVPGLEGELATAREDNVQLIVRATLAYADQVDQVLLDPENEGLRVEELRDLLVERGQVSQSRAMLIARDQTTRTNGIISRHRMQSAGVERFLWSTSQDERVRPSHAQLEGANLSWEDVKRAEELAGSLIEDEEDDTPFPSSPIQCRCVALPWFEEVEEPEAEEETEEDEPEDEPEDFEPEEGDEGPDDLDMGEDRADKNVAGHHWIRPEKRAAIYLRDGGRCVYCSSDKSLSLDHIIPRELGGTHHEKNLVTACVSCNSRRQDMPLKDWIRALHADGHDVKGLAGRIKAYTGKDLDIEAGKRVVAEKKLASAPKVEASEPMPLPARPPELEHQAANERALHSVAGDDRPRVPAGSPQGGQFAPKGDAAAASDEDFVEDDFDPEKHPRVPAGQPGGGQFGAGEGATGPSAPKSPRERFEELPQAKPAVDEDPVMNGHEDEKRLAQQIADRTAATSPEERRAVKEFTGGSGLWRDIRSFERDPAGFASTGQGKRAVEAWKGMAEFHTPEEAKSQSSAESHAKNLEGFFAKATPTPGLVYRGAIVDDAKLERLLTSDTLRMPATSSASRHAEVGMDFAHQHEGPGTKTVFRLRQTSGVAVEQISSHLTEREILLPKGATFKITGRSQTANFLIIDGEEIPK